MGLLSKLLFGWVKSLARHSSGTIPAIKAYKERTGACLLDAKNTVVAFQISQGVRKENGSYTY